MILHLNSVNTIAGPIALAKQHVMSLRIFSRSTFSVVLCVSLLETRNPALNKDVLFIMVMWRKSLIYILGDFLWLYIIKL